MYVLLGEGYNVESRGIGGEIFMQMEDQTLVKTKKVDLLEIPKFLKRKFDKNAEFKFTDVVLGKREVVWLTEIQRKDKKNEEQNDSTITVAEQKKIAEYKPSIQEAMAEKLSEYIGEAEALVDDFTENNCIDHEFFKYLKQNSVPQASARKIVEYYRPYVLEMEELMKSDCDKQLKEGFEHLNKKDIIAHRDFYQSLINDANAQVNAKKATRKSRKRKAPSKDKIVKRVQYMKESTELKATSIDPVEILGATQLWVFNVKKRKLGVYIASDLAGLYVKGTTIQSFNTSESIQKTIRKPKSIIRDVINAGKVKLRKIMLDIKAKESALTGRISKDVLILKVVK